MKKREEEKNSNNKKRKGSIKADPLSFQFYPTLGMNIKTTRCCIVEQGHAKRKKTVL